MKVSEQYNKIDLIKSINDLSIEQKGLNIITTHGGKMISNSSVSKKYELFDFPNFAIDVIKEIENYFTPEKSILRIDKGQQELRLIGEEVIVNGDVYHKMFNIFNSSDRTRALGLNTGLIRFVCTNGMVIGVENELANLKVKHFKNSLPEQVEIFLNSLNHFDLSINQQATKLETLQNNHVSFKEVAGGLLVEKDGLITPSSVVKLKAFSRKLLLSETDRLENLAKEQIELLKNPHLYNEMVFGDIDIEMSSYQALNCYTEVFRNYASDVLDRETNRILELV